MKDLLNQIALTCFGLIAAFIIGYAIARVIILP